MTTERLVEGRDITFRRAGQLTHLCFMRMTSFCLNGVGCFVPVVRSKIMPVLGTNLRIRKSEMSALPIRSWHQLFLETFKVKRQTSKVSLSFLVALPFLSLPITSSGYSLQVTMETSWVAFFGFNASSFHVSHSFSCVWGSYLLACEFLFSFFFSIIDIQLCAELLTHAIAMSHHCVI